ncbi:MAG: phosphodiester glycosidase family protein [Sphingobacteriia bacterium]|jgi:exopolysaccharide biosynthesis protein
MRIFNLLFLLFPIFSAAQIKWINVDADYQPLPNGVHVYFSNDSIEGKPSRAFYVSANLKEPSLSFTTQVGNGKRFTPAEYFTKESNPLLVVNATFFEFVRNSNLNMVVKDGKMLAYNLHTIAGKGKDTLTYRHPFGSVIGISKSGKADIVWSYTDSSSKYPLAIQRPINAIKDSSSTLSKSTVQIAGDFKKWKIQTAIGGGPVLVQEGKIKITNNEELKFAGKALFDKHPRTAMGYTNDGQLIIMAVEGRFPGKAEGANLEQLAKMLIGVGCEEAMNLDGGGSSCLLVNGKQTITPSDKEGQRPVPAVFLIKHD